MAAIVSIVGVSKSGKTTLLNLIGCLDTPTEGEIILNGISIKEQKKNQLADIRRDNIGFVFQTFNLIPVLTAFENVEFVLTLKEYDKKKGKELENTTYEIFSDLEPSVKEFKEWIKSISEGLTKKDLVIVYDNMDRLPPEKVKEIWSSIHTFFAEEEYDKYELYEPPFVGKYVSVYFPILS